MVNFSADTLDRTFAALADPTRRAILARLTAGEAAVTDLADPFAMSLPAILKHLRVLEAADLVAGEKRGRVHRYRLQATTLQSAAAWLAHYRPFWEGQFDALASYLEETDHDT